MTWSNNTEPNSIGYYLCTIKEPSGYRYVAPVLRAEWPKENFYWADLAYGCEVVACIKFPKPYDGVIL